MPRGTDPSLNRRKLRVELRRNREQAGLTQQWAAQELDWSLSKLIRLEKGMFNISLIDLRALLGVYGVTDARKVDELEEMARHSKGLSWWSAYTPAISQEFAEYLGYETAATSLSAYHPVVIPALLQTEDYARALLTARTPVPGRIPTSGYRPAEPIDSLVELRLERQERVFSHDDEDPVMSRLSFVVDEAALRRRVGGPFVMRQQLRHLMDVAENTRAELRVLPFSAGGHFATGSAFTLMGFEDDDDLLYLEGGNGRTTPQDDLEWVAGYQEFWAEMEDMALGGTDALVLIDEAMERLPDE